MARKTHWFAGNFGLLLTLFVVLLQMPTWVHAEPLHPDRPFSASINPMRFELQGMDLRDVFKLLAQKGNINIVIGDDVQGKVSIFLRDVDAWAVLNTVVEANQLAYEIDNNIVRIMSAERYRQRNSHPFHQVQVTRIIPVIAGNPESMARVLNHALSEEGQLVVESQTGALVVSDRPEYLDRIEALVRQLDQPVEHTVIQLAYADPEVLAPLIREHLSPGVGSVSAHPEQHALILADRPGHLAQLQQLVQQLDSAPAEVLIDASIVQLTLTNDRRQGINWEAALAAMDGLSAVSRFGVLPAGSAGGFLAVGNLTEGTDAEASLDWLQTLGTTNLLSSPRILVLDQHEAKILVGTNQAYVTTTTTVPATGGSTISEQVTFIEVGVKLSVKPRVHPDGYVTLRIRPEVSSVAETLTTGQGNVIPIIQTSEAETTVTVRDGSTIVIAGLIKDNKLETHRQVPFLGQLPLLGWLFGSQSVDSEKTELVILLTPRIIKWENDGYIPTVDKL